jgi:hypothetical protein
MMNHPHPDELLLFASGELTEPRMTDVASHVQTCSPCRDQLTQLDQSLIALGGEAWPRRSRSLVRPAVWGGVALAAAAALAVVFTRPAQESPRSGWVPTATWSRTAGYVAGGTALLDIDAQLTRLEQERYYGRP